jgi:signal transduction histidine kinase/CheY-like chemotaxis protein
MPKNSRKTIILGTSMVLLLMLILIVSGISLIKTSHQRVDVIIDGYYVKIAHLSVLRDTARERAISLHRVFLLTDEFEREDEIQKFYSLGGDFIHAREYLDNIPMDVEEQEAYAKVVSRVQIGGRLQLDTVDMVLAGKIKEAHLLLMDKVVPAQDEVMDKISALRQLMGARVDEAAHDVSRYYHKAVMLMSIIGGVIFLLSGYIVYYVVSKISRIEDESSDRAEKLAETNQELVGLTENLEELVISRTRELADARDRAVSASQVKSTFLANMSHELRTPMNAILGYSEMLMEEAKDVGQDDFIPDLKKINQAGDHLLSLINDVLDLSKIESGKMEAFAEDIDVGALIDQVSGTAQPLMGKNNNQFKIERGEQLGRAHQDITKLRQSLLNLLSNAAKFTHEGTITLHVERKSQADGEWLVFSVSDTGIGIPADKLGHVFEEFGQADSSTTRNYGGTGLGLPISRRFCQMLGGDLTLRSSAGEGSTFTMRIPVLLPGIDAEPPVAIMPIKTDTELEALRISGAGHTVLVIDDDPEARDIVERFLHKDGFEVVAASSGEEGLRLAHKLQPAAITLDVMMPDMDGWSVLRALKADPVLHDVPVVMLTMVDDKSKGYSLGATDYLTKPVDRNQLHNALARYYTPGEPCSVLLVEDDEPTREVMARTLEKSEWQVSEAGNGREALDRLAQKKPQLILLDLMMPVMDGFDFLLEMRANPEWQDIPVIVLTAKDLTDEDRRILSGRVEQIVEKGASSHEQVVNLIHKAVEHTPTYARRA